MTFEAMQAEDVVPDVEDQRTREMFRPGLHWKWESARLELEVKTRQDIRVGNLWA